MSFLQMHKLFKYLVDETGFTSPSPQCYLPVHVGLCRTDAGSELENRIIHDAPSTLPGMVDTIDCINFFLDIAALLLRILKNPVHASSFSLNLVWVRFLGNNLRCKWLVFQRTLN